MPAQIPMNAHEYIVFIAWICRNHRAEPVLRGADYRKNVMAFQRCCRGNRGAGPCNGSVAFGQVKSTPTSYCIMGLKFMLLP